MARFTLIGACLGVSIVAWIPGPAAQPNGQADRATPKSEGATLNRADALRSMVEQARETYKAMEATAETHVFSIEGTYAWSTRLRDAEAKSAPDKTQLLQAYADHLGRMRNLQSKVKALHDVGTKGGGEHQYRATKFFVAEAELLVLDARTEKEPTP